MEKAENTLESSGYFYLMPLLVFIFSFLPSLTPTILLSSPRLRKLYNKASIISAGLLLAILFMDFMPHMAHGGCTHGVHSHASASKSAGCFSRMLHAVKNAHPGLAVAGLVFIGLILIDQKIIKHKHCGNEEELTAEEKGAKHIHEMNKVHNEEAEIKLCCTEGLKYQTTAKQALVFIFVFSVHSIFEGMAFSPSDKTNSGVLFIGLIVHKVLESITIGVALFSSTFSVRASMLLLLFYSFLTPLGMILAMTISSVLDSFLVKEVFMGLAFGSLSFIVLVEMLPPIFHSLTGARKILYLFSGYIFGAILIGYVHS